MPHHWHTSHPPISACIRHSLKLPPPLSLQVTITPSHPTKVMRHKLTAQSPRRRSSCLTCRTDSGCQIKLNFPPFSLPHAGAYSPALPRRPSGTREPRVRLAKDTPRSSVCNLMLTCPMSSAPGVVLQRRHSRARLTCAAELERHHLELRPILHPPTHLLRSATLQHPLIMLTAEHTCTPKLT